MIYELLKEKNLSQICTGSLLPECKNWQNLPEDTKQYFCNEADKLKGARHISLPAALYMDFKRIGDRAKYEAVYFKRRADLMTLTIAECIKADGGYLDDIINLIWAICEETSWVVPAHNYTPTELPDFESTIFIDLFSSETGAAISFAYYLLGNLISETSPLTKRRMEVEVEKRIIEPYLKYNNFWYMGFEGDRQINNWNPWINSNVIIAFAVFTDAEKLIQGIEKTAKSIDAFIKSYNPDGACDEGPGYFGAAGAALFDYLESLADITNGAVNIFDSELIKNMARYIYRVYIGEDYYVNFADGSARPGAPAKLLARVGEAIGDDNLIGFASGLTAKSSGANSFFSHIYRNIKNLFQKEYNGRFIPPKVHWFDGTQILTARDSEGSKAGMFISAKGGHNAESHNHNDIGHFILYYNEKPVIIDIGVETYTKKTFSAERYDIWTMQSCYHNLPAINGFAQSAGKDKRASDIDFKHDGCITSLSMQLKHAYPEQAAIESYIREFIFEHGKSLTVRDKYNLKECSAPFILNFMCANKPVIAENTVNLGENMKMTFDNALLSVNIEEIEITDARLKKDWQRDYLYRIRLSEKETRKENNITLRFQPVL